MFDVKIERFDNFGKAWTDNLNFSLGRALRMMIGELGFGAYVTEISKEHQLIKTVCSIFANTDRTTFQTTNTDMFMKLAAALRMYLELRNDSEIMKINFDNFFEMTGCKRLFLHNAGLFLNQGFFGKLHPYFSLGTVVDDPEEIKRIIESISINTGNTWDKSTFEVRIQYMVDFIYDGCDIDEAIDVVRTYIH